MNTNPNNYNFLNLNIQQHLMLMLPFYCPLPWLWKCPLSVLFKHYHRQCVLFVFNPHWCVLSLSVLRMNYTSAKMTLSAIFKLWIPPAFFVMGNIYAPIFLNLLHFLHFFSVQQTHTATNTCFQYTPTKWIVPQHFISMLLWLCMGCILWTCSTSSSPLCFRL